MPRRVLLIITLLTSADGLDGACSTGSHSSNYTSNTNGHSI